jgi:hypothetical protein
MGIAAKASRETWRGYCHEYGSPVSNLSSCKLQAFADPRSAGMCAIIKGIYLMQLREQDFYYNGKDVVIWTVVETATAIIAASIPILRVFFKEAVSSYHNTTNNANRTQVSSKTVPLSSLSRSRHSTIGRGKDSGWTTLEPIEDTLEDGDSQRRILRDEEYGPQKRSVAEHGGIMQTNTITVMVDEDHRAHDERGRVVRDPK